MGPALIPLELGDLLNPAGVATAFERRVEPDLDHAVDEPFAKHISREAKHVQIVVPAAHLGGQVVVARCRPDARELVCRDAHPKAGPTNEYAALDLTAADLSCDQGGEVVRVDGVRTVGTNVENVVAQTPQEFHHFGTYRLTAVIAADRNSHDCEEAEG